jgi:hypothetical protein
LKQFFHSFKGGEGRLPFSWFMGDQTDVKFIL